MFSLLTTVLLALLAPFQAATPASSAPLSLDPVFGAHMVLQCEQPILLWGKAEPRARVQVDLQRSDGETSELASAVVEAGADGSWQVELRAQPASFASHRLILRTQDQSLTYDDILFGEVWFAAGQSNMEWPLERSMDWPALLNRMSEVGKSDRGPSAIRCFQAKYTATGAGGSWDQATVQGLSPDRFRQGGWSRTSSASIASMSAVAWYFGEALLHELERPIGLIDVAAGGTPTEAWLSRASLAQDPQTAALVNTKNWLHHDALGVWCRERAAQNLAHAIEQEWQIPGNELGPHHAFQPGFMWQTAVQPFTRLAIRGVLWYQGESNAESAERVVQHEAIFRKLVSSWRKAWRQPELPFLFVQLPSMNRPHWPAFREQQRQLNQSLAHTGMAVSLDWGDPRDVHPRHKRAVGERLSRWARAQVYGQACLHRGPRLQGAHFDAAGIRLEFAAIGQGLQAIALDQPSGFEWQDPNGDWHPAILRRPIPSAQNSNGPTAIQEVWLGPAEEGQVALMRQALAVRYAWAPVAVATLRDSDGLPASPFLQKIEASARIRD